ncbi:hypothetical protein OHA21_09755 [Actinoplanes sp. NBC_00393]|uniref:hypothetical protein n=1 Tax=Actinoplanes sp. NBC_00393 TaxID=2975953 RepID=UPI002E1D9178
MSPSGDVPEFRAEDFPELNDPRYANFARFSFFDDVAGLRAAVTECLNEASTRTAELDACATRLASLLYNLAQIALSSQSQDLRDAYLHLRSALSIVEQASANLRSAHASGERYVGNS